jgi:hypothetical protein
MTLMETAQLLGNFGEFVGAFAVVATLFYLARQVAEAKAAMWRQTSQDVNLVFNHIHNVVAASPELAAALAKMENAEQLNPQEVVQVRAHNLAQFNAFENVWTQAVAQNHPVEEFAVMFNTFLSLPSVLEHWEEFSWITADDFQKFISETRERI